ncbi:hypothetical protein KI809_01560 [Geobacter pelophilus]|uniref:Lipopolysaccharide-assembly n=1 Tax=Geoanaerobacter pelophilus TaxID=60036 RepID=A0AAW4KYH4_9BACT|nr:hypothetical protein [Geoanaerobacter pelophilus]
MSRSINAFVLLGAILMLAGCGYGLAARTIPGNQTIAIPIFANKTLRPNLEACVTSKLVEQFARAGGGRVVNHDKAELELTGAILSYSESASAYTAGDKVALYQVTMTVEASLRQLSTGNVLWKGTLRAVQDYPTSNDLALKLNAQDAALRELCRKLAEGIERESGNHF